MNQRRSLLALLLCSALFFAVLSLPASAVEGFANISVKNAYEDGRFTDVKASDWFAPYVKAVYQYGFMIGNSASTFDPDGNVKLSETIAIAARLHAVFHTGEETFENGFPWYQPYVSYLMQQEALPFEIENYEDYATRAEFVRILHAALPEEVFTPQINAVAPGSIPDVGAEESFPEAVYSLYAAGILTGSDQYGTFRPESSIRRCEVSAVVSRIVDPASRVAFTLETKAGAAEKTVLRAFVSAIDEKTGTLTIDPVEFLGWNDTERLAELGIDPLSLADGYTIYNPKKEALPYTASPDAVYKSFVTDNGGAWELREVSFKEFAEALNRNTILYEVTVSADGLLTELSEVYLP